MNALQMEIKAVPSEARINDRETALFLVNSSKNSVLRPFMAAEVSLAEAAKLLGVGKTKMSYWISRLLEMGLIAVVRIEKRGRYQSPIYRACADTFTFPLELVPVESDEALLAIHQAGFWPEVYRSLSISARQHTAGWHVRIQRMNSILHTDILPGSDDLEDGRICNHWGMLSLEATQARDMRSELRRVMGRYTALSNVNRAGKRGKPHFVCLLQVEQAAP